MISRRAMLCCAAAAAAQSLARSAGAMGRIPMGGSLSVRIPHETSRLDPHDLADPMAAIVGAAVFEPVFRLDPSGAPYASLAQSLPMRDGASVRVSLRDGLRSARGKALDARDFVASIERARAGGASALLSGIPKPTIPRGQSLAVLFRDVDPTELARVLSSPLIAMTSRASTPAAPDGTGAFRADPTLERLTLTRNRHAARGPSFLDQVTVLRADEIAEPLRAFEARQVDIGWLGAGYYRQRSDAVAFDFGAAAWVVLRTGSEAGTWNGPGVAQRLVDGIDPSRLAHLALGSFPAQSSWMAWGGGPCELLAPARSAHLLEVAKAVAAILSAPGHEVTAVGLAEPDLARKRRSGAFSLMIDSVRPLGPGGVATLIALATADDPARARSLVRSPPKLTSYAPRVLARTLRLGVVGELRVAGAAITPVRWAAQRDATGWDLAGTYRLGV